MARAILELVGDPASMERAFGRVRKASQGATQGVAQDARASATAQEREARRGAAAQIREIERTKKAAEKAEAAKVRAEKEATRIAEQEARARGLSAEKEAKAKQRAIEAVTRVAAAEERKRTATERTESSARAANERRVASERTARERRERREGRERETGLRRTGSNIQQAVGAAAQFGSTAHGMIQDARQRRANVDRSIGGAVFQAGGTRDDVVRTSRMVREFALRNPGLDSEQIAASISANQEEFSGLGNANSHEDAATRTRRMDAGVSDSLRTAALARDLNSDTAQMMRLGGLFAQNGIRDPRDRRAMLLEAAGLAQRGALEMGSLTREAMPAITGRLALAQSRLGANATPEQRQVAARNAFAQSVTEMEFMRGQGISANRSGNAMLAMNNALGSDVTQRKALQNIRSRFGRNSAAEQALFETDTNGPRGAMRLRAGMTDASRFVTAFGAATGNDRELFQNTFTGGGHGNPMAFQRNWRDASSTLLARDAEGRLGVDRIAEMRNGASLTEADVDRGHGVFAGDEQAQLTANNEANANALAGNTTAINTLSNRLASFGARNPLAMPAATAGGGAIASIFGPQIAGLLGRAGGALGPVLGLAATGYDAYTGVRDGKSTTQVAAGVADDMIPAGGFFRRMLGGGDTSAVGAVAHDAAQGGGGAQPLTAQGIGTAVAAALHASPIVATVNPVDAEHATTQAISNRQAPR